VGELGYCSGEARGVGWDYIFLVGWVVICRGISFLVKLLLGGVDVCA